MNFEKLDEALSYIEAEEVLTEAMLCRKSYGSKEEYSISINPNDNYGQGYATDPYFKVYDALDYSKAKNCIRVHLVSGMCEHHNDGKGGIPFGDMGWKRFLEDVMDTMVPSKFNPAMQVSVYDRLFQEVQVGSNLTEAQIDALKKVNVDEQKKKTRLNFITDVYWGGKKEKGYRR